MGHGNWPHRSRDPDRDARERKPRTGSAWANVVVALAFYDTTSNDWDDDGKILIHYRLSTGAQAWIYGNIEQ